MSILRSFYGRCRNLLAGVFQYTILIHIFDQISSKTNTSDLWRSEILSKKEATFLKLLVVNDGVSFLKCCFFLAQYLRAPKVRHVSLPGNMVTFMYKTGILKKNREQISAPPIKWPKIVILLFCYLKNAVFANNIYFMVILWAVQKFARKFFSIY